MMMMNLITMILHLLHLFLLNRGRTLVLQAMIRQKTVMAVTGLVSSTVKAVLCPRRNGVLEWCKCSLYEIILRSPDRGWYFLFLVSSFQKISIWRIIYLPITNLHLARGEKILNNKIPELFRSTPLQESYNESHTDWSLYSRTIAHKIVRWWFFHFLHLSIVHYLPKYCPILAQSLHEHHDMENRKE